MKTTSTLLAVALAASYVTAVPSPEAEPKKWRKHGGWLGFCGAPGTMCLGKREAEANPWAGPDITDTLGNEIGYCGAPGNPCNTVKRAAHAIADALAEARAIDSEGTFCGVPGAPCDTAKNEIDDIADKAQEAYTKVYEREADAVAEADPRRRFRGWLGFCGAPGTMCLGKREAEADAEAEARRGGWLGFCGAPGTMCLSGRDALPENGTKKGFYDPEEDVHLFGRGASAEPEPKKWRKHGGWLGFCGAPGTMCLGRREAEAMPAPEAEPEAKKWRKHGGWLGFCGAPGTMCLGKRNAEALAEADAEPKKWRKHGGWLGFCGAPGTMCLGKREAEAEAEAEAKIPKPRVGYAHRNHHKHPKHPKHKHHKLKHAHGRLGFCGAPGTMCLGGRDAKAIGEVFRRNDPSYLTKECFKEGNECHTLLKIQQAVEEMKREAADAENVTDPIEKLKHCDKNGAKCSGLAGAHQYAVKNNKADADQKERDCNGPDGACTAAKRDLEELENSINDALAFIETDNE